VYLCIHQQNHSLRTHQYDTKYLNHIEKADSLAFQQYRGLGVADGVIMTKYNSAQKVSIVIFPVLRYQLSSDLQNYFRSRCTGLYVGLYAQHSATIKKNTETMADAMEIAPNECPPTPPARRFS
jgi:hypothetical protein